MLASALHVFDYSITLALTLRFSEYRNFKVNKKCETTALSLTNTQSQAEG